jgi:PadR family transcriptional regulator, regulatory protein AphA
MSKSEIGFATFSLENLALGLLMQGPRHGYQLYQEYEIFFLPIWTVGRSKFYAALAVLHETGFLAVTTEPQDDRPTRKIYSLTDSGRARFTAWLYEPVTPIRAVRVEFLAKLRFFPLLNLPDAHLLIDAQIAVCRGTLDGWLAVQAAAHNDDPFFALVHDFRRRQIELILDWLAACKRELTIDD